MYFKRTMTNDEGSFRAIVYLENADDGMEQTIIVGPYGTVAAVRGVITLTQRQQRYTPWRIKDVKFQQADSWKDIT